MRIGIIGSASVAKTLAAGFLKHGHSVTLGTRDTTKLADFQREHPAAQVGSFAEAAAYGEIVVLAVKGSVASAALAAAGAANLAGKPVFDATNPIEEGAPVDGVLRFFTDINGSLMERLQGEFPEARFVKVFNSVGAAAMVNPTFAGGPPTMFICGNDDAAKAVARDVLTQFGHETADMGTAVAARAIEPLCMLWCIPGFRANDWNHAFKLLH
jgi:predicted dinucleotide-binding enzyme